MKRFAMFMVIASLAMSAFGQDPKPEVPLGADAAEAERRGDLVVVTGEGPRGAEQDAIIAATSPPADDSHKWYITIFSRKDCAACNKLKADFASKPELSAFVASSDETMAWAHFNVYDVEDATQRHRVSKYYVPGLPTLVIQPPRNGSWGDPAVVVWQESGYNGDSKALAKKISAKVKEFAAKMSHRGFPKQAYEEPHYGKEGGSKQQVVGHSTPVSGPPPFPTPAPVDPFNPQVPFNPVVNPFSPDAPDNPDSNALGWLERAVVGIVRSLFSGTSLIAFLLIANLAVSLIGPLVKRTPNLWDDKAYAFFQGVLSQMKETNDPETTPPPVVVQAKASSRRS